MSSPADIVRLYLEYVGVGIPITQTPAAGEWPIVTSSLPIDPDNCLAIQDAGGMVKPRHQNDGFTLVYPLIIVVVRSENYPTGYNKGLQITEVMKRIGLPPPAGVGRPVVTVGADQWTLRAAHLSVPITKIGMEEKNRRELFTINFRLTVDAPAVDLSGLTV